eukprot:TRINITY_DN57758_c0_g1_i1.p1 TRINITY_DN57758_c0_g1~~TRINITY_DN57758_c0_g1_i1.p1  ORF type:complete len:333 (+),score=54.55 TRINITY_DN57758_c0_g1_i1:104-1000(+)
MESVLGTSRGMPLRARGAAEARRGDAPEQRRAPAASALVRTPRARRDLRVAASLLGAAIALTISGCDVPQVGGYFEQMDLAHVVVGSKLPNWRKQPEYYGKFAHQAAPGEPPRFNSCMDSSVAPTNLCNGRGSCLAFDSNDVDNPVFFCSCQPDWGGPECQVRRKRQSVAWALSLVAGPLGVDELYLGWPVHAAYKVLFSALGAAAAAVGGLELGGVIVGSVWIFDVVRIGSAPVLASNFRVQQDLPVWMFTIFTLVHFGFVAILFETNAVYRVVTTRRLRWDRMTARYGSSAKAPLV